MGHQNIKLAIQFDKVIAVNHLMAVDLDLQGANLGVEGGRLLIDLPIKGVDLGAGARFRRVDLGAGARLGRLDLSPQACRDDFQRFEDRVLRHMFFRQRAHAFPLVCEGYYSPS